MNNSKGFQFFFNVILFSFKKNFQKDDIHVYKLNEFKIFLETKKIFNIFNT